MQPSTATRSPTLTPLGDGPPVSISTTRPANSCPRVTGSPTPVSGLGSGLQYSGPKYSLTSLAQMVPQPTSTIDHPGRGLGSSTSSSRMSLWPWNRNAFMPTPFQFGGEPEAAPPEGPP